MTMSPWTSPIEEPSVRTAAGSTVNSVSRSPLSRVMRVVIILVVLAMGRRVFSCLPQRTRPLSASMRTALRADTSAGTVMAAIASFDSSAEMLFSVSSSANAFPCIVQVKNIARNRAVIFFIWIFKGFYLPIVGMLFWDNICRFSGDYAGVLRMKKGLKDEFIGGLL